MADFKVDIHKALNRHLAFTISAMAALLAAFVAISHFLPPTTP